MGSKRKREGERRRGERKKRRRREKRKRKRFPFSFSFYKIINLIKDPPWGIGLQFMSFGENINIQSTIKANEKSKQPR